MSSAPDWSLEGRDWPHREHSRFVEADGVRWHVQVMGAGPAVLLVHGTGAATHSWRGLAPILARKATVIAPDLPGHGFSMAPPDGGGFSLPRVANGLSALLGALDIAPRTIVGHSAGAAIAIRMALDRPDAFDAIAGLNAALLPFPGLFGAWAALLARMLYSSPFASGLLSLQSAQPGAMRGLMRGAGSELDDASLDFYARLFRKPTHLRSTLGLMAHWDLRTLQQEMRLLRPRLVLISAEKDRAVPPQSCLQLRGIVPDISFAAVEGVGHLAHEEAPERVAALLQELAVA